MTQTQTQSRDVILREEVFTDLLKGASRDFGQWVETVTKRPDLLLRIGTTTKLAEAAHSLETFLDDHGARHNRSFVTFGEMVASIRGLVSVKGLGLHLLNRLPLYRTLGSNQELATEMESAHGRLDSAILELCQALIAEAGTLGIRWSAVSTESEHDVDQRLLLPRNLDAGDSVDERQHIAEMGARFLSVLEASRNLGLSRVRPVHELPEFVANHASEERCRWYESAVHNIQSMYDTYVLRTSLEQENIWVQHLRGHASVSLHLLEMATGLVHFYERHENDVRHEPAREAISAVVAKEVVLDLAVNTCLRQAYLYVEACAELSGRILETFVAKDTVELVMPEGVTLHARPLALIVQIARHYGTPVEVTIEGESCPANSLMGLIMLGGKHPSPEAISVRGDSRAINDLALLFARGLGETGEPLPAELSYLRTV